MHSAQKLVEALIASKMLSIFQNFSGRQYNVARNGLWGRRSHGRIFAQRGAGFVYG